MNEERTHCTEAEQIAGMALVGAEVRQVGDTPLAFLPEGVTVRDLEQHLPMPTRKRGTAHLRDLASFLAVVKDQRNDATRIYRTTHPQPRFLAVFDDHAAAPGWREHRAEYLCPLSPEWQRWFGANAKQMSQESFAQFIEDNAPDIVDPPAADMLEVSRTLEAKKRVNFASGIRLSNGAQELTYEESIQGTAAKGKLQVPEVFTVGIPVFEGGPRYAVKARLRYRIQDGGKLTMWFDLERPHKIVEDAVAELQKEVEAATGLVTLNGSPA